ncbi:MAG: hypothetical protein JWM98_932 [Thermoleophilia bacterium]|nr:hypothetical protein [Thermoleophilia bacterium]
MTDTLRSNIARRHYRLAQTLTVGGSLAVGTLVVSRLVAFFREDFFLFYGLDDTEYHTVQEHAAAQLPLTVGQLVLAGIALFAVCAFIAMERRRLRQGCAMDRVCRAEHRSVVFERLSLGSLVDAFVMRTSTFAGVLLGLWLLQTSLERWLGGLGWGLEYADWRSLLPLASVFGVCVLAGMLVAATSLVGLRAIHVLELVFQRIALRRQRPRSAPPLARRGVEVIRTFREMLGCDILSRPPPVAAA